MNHRPIEQELRSILISILFVGLGILALIVGKQHILLEGDLIFVFLLLIPLLTYAILSGRLNEFKAVGLEAKFVDIARQSIDVSSETITPSENDLQIVAKSGLQYLNKMVERIDSGKPILLSLTLGPGKRYQRLALIRYIEALSQFRNFKFVVILHQDKRVFAYIPVNPFLELLHRKALADEFIQAINQGEINALSQYPGITKKTVSTKKTNIEALREMMSLNFDELIVTDEEERLKGVVERDQIVSKLLLSMAK